VSQDGSPTPPTQVSFAVTFFTGTSARTKREEVCELPRLAALIQDTRAPTKAQLPLLKLASFGDQPGPRRSLRYDRNVTSVSGIEVDYDGGVVSLDAAVQRLREAGVLALVHTSPSYRPDAPRWRVLAPFSRPLMPDQRAAMVARANGALGGVGAVESFALSQAFYFGAVVGSQHHRVVQVEGTPVDACGELDAVARGKVRGGAHGTGGRNGPVDEAGLVAEIRSGASYHQAAISLAGYWAYEGVSFEEAARRLQGLFDEVPESARDARWTARRADLFRTLEWIYQREAEKQDPDPAGAEVIDLGLLKAEIPRLARLGPAEYEARRKTAAARIKIATSRLDPLVKKERATQAGDGDLSGQAVAFPKDPPWTGDPVELTDWLDAVDAVLRETMVMTEPQRLAFSLWVVFTHCVDSFDNSPRLIVRSPLKRSGKTRLLRIARILVARGLSVVGISAAGLFRAVDLFRPVTVLLDESDLYLNDARKGAGAELNLALQALVNGGFDRDDAHIVRVEGERIRKPHLFSIWCALGLARIGNASSTIEDRSIVIALSRKATSEKVARLDRALRARLVELRRQVAHWAAAHADALSQADPELPEFTSDRASDCWRGLVAVADAGGQALGAQARAAALALTAEQEAETQEIELQALADIAPWLEAHPELTEVFTAQLTAHLHTLEHRPWPEYGRRQQPVSQSQLARLLARIGLVSTNVWRKAKPPATTRVSARGYSRESLESAIAKLVPSASAPKTTQRHRGHKQRPKN
jgi:hypothetical protein